MLLLQDGKYFLVLVNLQQQELEKCCVVAQSHLGDISSDPSLEEGLHSLLSSTC